MTQPLKAQSPMATIFLCALLLLSAGLVRAQDAFEAEQRAAQVQNPTGVTCTLSLPDGKTQFQQGELIPVTLQFTSSKPGQYQFDPFQDDRMPQETFHVSPSEGVVDPLAEERGQGGGFSGYMPPPVPLTDKPATLTLPLNSRLRFDRPGTYRLYVTSKRILDGKSAPRVSFFASGPPVASNIVSFTILPADPAWAHAQVQSALAQSPPNLTILGFLGTQEAAQALLGLLATDRFPRSSESNGYVIRQSLIGFPDRAWLVGEMERDLTAPNYTVTQPFLETLETLAARQQKAGIAGSSERTYWMQAADAVPAKSPQTLPMTLHTLLETAWLTSLGNDKAVEARLPGLKRRMATVFDRLPPLPQDYLLSSDWTRMRTPVLLPPLRRMWAAAVRPENGDTALNDLILRRLYELSPKEGRALILKEAVAPRPRVTADALSLLPDRTLPELDKALAANLAGANADKDTTSHLIARYATLAIFPQVRAFYGSPDRGWNCAFQAGMLAYFLRVKPAFGAGMVRKALAMRKQTGCYRYLFTDIAPLRYDANLETAAIAHLNDPDPEVITNAADALGKYGTRRAETALWTRLKQKGGDSKAREQFEWRLVAALTMAQNWYESPAQMAKIRALCSTPSGQRQADEALMRTEAGKVSVYYPISDEVWWNVGRYNGLGRSNFLAKMAQFPRGTVFLWQDINVGLEGERLFTQTQHYAQAHGMRLERRPTR